MISEESLRYWSLFGYKLGRLEFIWGKQLPETIAEFPKAKQELDLMLSNDFVPIETDYVSFSNSILLFYQRRDLEIYSSILIGICIQRYQLGKKVADKASSKMLIELAQSCLRNIPQKIIPDKSLIFTAIVLAGSADFIEVIDKVYEALIVMDVPNNKQSGNEVSNQVLSEGYLFISYSSKDRASASVIRNEFLKMGIKCWIAPESIPIGSDYTEVIVDAIEHSVGIILLLSSNSQESVWVPKELDIALSAEKPVFPIHIDDSILNSKMKFRLSNAQIAECYNDLEILFPSIAKVILNQLHYSRQI